MVKLSTFIFWFIICIPLLIGVPVGVFFLLKPQIGYININPSVAHIIFIASFAASFLIFMGSHIQRK